MNEANYIKLQLERERKARKEAEDILEARALKLYTANEALQKLNVILEDEVRSRTKALKSSKERYKKLINDASDVFYSVTAAGYFSYINRKGIETFGYERDEIIGQHFLNFIVEEFKEDIANYYLNFLNKKIKSGYVEFAIKSKSGEVSWVGQNVDRVDVEDGSFYFNAVARDITPRKVTEAELKKVQKHLFQSEIKYRSVFENLDLGLMEVDNDGIILRVYDRFSTMTGFSQDELIGKRAIDLLIVEEYREEFKNQESAINNGGASANEVRIKRKNGDHIWVIISSAPFYNEFEEVIGSLCIHFNITERKELESNLKVARYKAIKAQQAEQQFLANMSHEIRTPLNAIIGMSHLLKGTKLDNKQEEIVEILSDSAELLKGLVSDILDITKIDAGIAEKNESVFEINGFAKRLINTFNLKAKEKGINITSELMCGDVCLVNTDKQWLNQVLINLLSNAIKFTAKGDVYLTIQKTIKTKNISTFYFEVKDTGIGMKQSEVDNVFFPFKQASSKIRTEYGGTGLGLSIATKLVALLNGELGVKSKEREGSTFYFTLDIETREEELMSKPLSAQGIINNNKDIMLLVVEDNLMNQKYISSLLNKWSISFNIAENGKQAIDLYETGKYDLVFMDLSMPIMDGYEATSEIRKIPGDFVPIVALTASTFLSKKQLALRAGMTDFLAKPFTPEELLLMIQKYLDGNPIDENGNKIHVFSDKLDRESLKKFYLVDTSYALDMFITYDDVISEELEILESKIDSGIGEEIRKHIHKIKPMFSMVGLKKINEACETLESSIDSTDIVHIKSMAYAILAEVRGSHHLVEAEIKSLELSIKENR